MEELFAITDRPIEVEQVMRKVVHPNCGAVNLFVGTVREMTFGKRTLKLEYTAYPAMAASEMQKIGQRIQELCPEARVAITHRIGLLQISDIAVVVAVSTPHRKDSFDYARYAIEEIKRLVPIWKKEFGEDGTAWIGDQTGTVEYPSGQPELPGAAGLSEYPAPSPAPVQALASVEEHRSQAPAKIGVCVLTISDTRTLETDKSGRLLCEQLEKAGHTVHIYQIVPDERDAIADAVLRSCRDPQVEAVILNGGTGISKRDITYEVVAGLLHKELPGFGELFRAVSYWQDIGSAAMMSRAIAGIHAGRAIFSLPGSTGAVKLALEKLILPELPHMIREIRKQA